jgi:hypothetical protein
MFHRSRMRGLAPAVYLGTVLSIGTVDVRAQEASTPPEAKEGDKLEEVVIARLCKARWP